MSEDWDVYLTHVEDRPASMFLDMGLAEEAPIPVLSILAYVTIDVRDPTEHGFIKREEYETLMHVEDALVGALEHDTSMFVGRCTTNGQVDLFFYMDNAKGVEEKVESVMGRFPDYDWDMGLVEEPGWDTYLEYLFPDEQGMDAIWNNRVCRNLESCGDDLAAPREIDYWAQFRTQADMESFIPEAEQEGFRATVSEKTEEKPFEVLLQRVDAPSDIHDVTWPLRELIGAHGGVYDGWGCAVTK